MPSPQTTTEDAYGTGHVQCSRSGRRTDTKVTALLAAGEHASQWHQHGERNNHDNGDHHDHLAIAEVLARDDERRSRIPLGRAEREHAACICTRTAEHPA